MIHMICVLSTLNRLRCRQIIVSPAQQGPDTRPVTTNSPKTRQSHSLPVPHAPLQRAICDCSYLQRMDETGMAHGATLVAGISASVALTPLSPPSSQPRPLCQVSTFADIFDRISRTRRSGRGEHGGGPRRVAQADWCGTNGAEQAEQGAQKPADRPDAAGRCSSQRRGHVFLGGLHQRCVRASCRG